LFKKLDTDIFEAKIINKAIRISMNIDKTKGIKLALCGIENVSEVVLPSDYVVFGDWMSEIISNEPPHRPQLFPFDFEHKEIQSKNDILAQDKRVRDIYEMLLPLLAAELNKLHNLDSSTKQWEVVIGYWLRHFLDALMVRFVLVSAAMRTDIDHIYMLDVSNIDILPQPESRNAFAVLCNSSRTWNQFIVSKIAKIIIDNSGSDWSTTSVVAKSFSNTSKKNSKKTKASSSIVNGVKSIIKNLISLAGKGISRLFPSEILMYSPNLNPYEMFTLARKLGKIPFIYFLKELPSIDGRNFTSELILAGSQGTQPNFDNRHIDLDMRAGFDGLIVSDEMFSSLVNELLSQSIPRCYIEGWSQLNKELELLNLPKTVKQIYVGSGIISDEILRLYVSKMMDKECEFIISQHGGVYGFSLIQEKTEYVEQRISDKWISWGWKSSNVNTVVPGPALKGQLKISKNSAKEFMLIALPPVRFSPSRLNYSDPYEIVQSHANFISSLDDSISNKVIIRPAPNHREFSYVKDFESRFYVSKKGSFSDDLGRSKLFVCTHNATTMLEALFANIPTIIMLPKYKYYTQHYLREDAVHMIQEMRDAGIYFDCPYAARDQVNLIWSDVDKWWNSNEIQDVVNKFCELYCSKSVDYLGDLARAIDGK